MFGSTWLCARNFPYLRLVSLPDPREIALIDIFCVLAFEEKGGFGLLILQTLIEGIDLRRIRPVGV